VSVGGVQWGIILVGLFVGCRCWDRNIPI